MKKPTLALITLCAASALLCAIVVFNAIEGSTGLPKISGVVKADTSGVIWLDGHSRILANGD